MKVRLRAGRNSCMGEVENTFRQLAEVTGDYVVLVDRDLTIRFASRSLGTHSQAELEGAHLRDFLTASVAEAACDCVRRVLERGHPDRFSMQIGAGAVPAQQPGVPVSPGRQDSPTHAPP